MYHTNVMMAIGTDVAVVCAESVPDERERERLLAALRKHHQARFRPQQQMEHVSARPYVCGIRRALSWHHLRLNSCTT